MNKFVEIDGVKYAASEADETVAAEVDGEKVLFKEDPQDPPQDPPTDPPADPEEDPKETVSLSKHLALKKKFEKLEKEGGLSDEDRELIQGLKKDKAVKALREAYDGEFEKLIKQYPDLANKSEQLFKLVQVDGNENKTLEEVALDTFGGFIEKSSSEDDAGGGGDGGGVDTSKIDFDNMNPEQTKAVMADPVAKKAYYQHCDGKQY